MESKRTNRDQMDDEILGFEKLWKSGLGKYLTEKEVNHVVSVNHPYEFESDGHHSHTMVVGMADIARCPQPFVMQVAVLAENRSIVQQHRMTSMVASLIGKEMPKALCDWGNDEKFITTLKEHLFELGRYCSENNMTFAIAILAAYNEQSHQIISSYGLSSYAPPQYFLSHWLDYLIMHDYDDKYREVVQLWEADEDWIEAYKDEIQAFEDMDSQQKEDQTGVVRTESKNGVQERMDMDKARKKSQDHLKEEGISAEFSDPVDQPDEDLPNQVRRLLGLLGDSDANES